MTNLPTTISILAALWTCEGGSKTAHPFGIVCHYHTVSEARKIATVEIEAAKRDYVKYFAYHSNVDFITYFGGRFCPTTGNLSPAEKKLNKNWIPNMRKKLK
jgi:hypothetical protein